MLVQRDLRFRGFGHAERQVLDLELLAVATRSAHTQARPGVERCARERLAQLFEIERSLLTLG